MSEWNTKNILLLAFALCGCCKKTNRVDIVTVSDGFILDRSKVLIDEEYVFKDFSKEYTDDGKCTVTINFEKEEEEHDKH